jgi:hypothetical protein
MSAATVEAAAGAHAATAVGPAATMEASTAAH